MSLFVAPSPLHGNGLFTDCEIQANDFIGYAFTRKKSMEKKFAQCYTETAIGSNVNHFNRPNIYLKKENGGIAMYAIHHIHPGDEILGDYCHLLQLFPCDDSLIRLIKFW